MNLKTETNDDITIVRVQEERLVYAMLSSFFSDVSSIIEGGSKKLVIDLTDVSYIDSASVGCLMDIYRAMAEREGVIKLVGLQERVETMVSMTGLHNFMEIFRDESAALASF